MSRVIRLLTATTAASLAGAVTCAGLISATPAATGQPAPAAVPALMAPAAPVLRPNVLLFTLDDMSIGDLAHMPRTERLLADQGAEFTDAIAPTPICVPARASILTGQYTHNHRAYTIEGAGGGFPAFDDRATLPVALKKAGYDTIFAGKYLNGYGVRDPRYIPPGWSDWRASIDFSTYSFDRVRYNVNRTIMKTRQYSSDTLSDFTTDIVKRPRRKTKPWFAWVNFVGPHHGGRIESDDPQRRWKSPAIRRLTTTMPAPRHRNDFRDLNLPRHPEMWEKNVRGNAFAEKPKTRAFKQATREVHQQRIEALQSIDEAVGKAVRNLRRTGQLRNTYFIFTSDNGFLTGHHNRVGKLIPYNRSLRIPFLVRGPGVTPGSKVRTTVTNADLGVTIASIAKARIRRKVDGVNLLRYLDRPTVLRTIPIEAYPVKGGKKRIYSGVRHGTWTYARLRNGSEELYNRATDPGELTNLARRPAHRKTLRQMRQLTRTYQDCVGATCRALPRT